MNFKITTGYIVFFFLLWIDFSITAQNIYYVSPNGSQEKNGSKKQPFGSIEEAQRYARKNNDNEAVIYLREGTYKIKRPLVFTAEDGNETKSLTVRSFPKEKVTISGSEQLALNWKPYKNGIMKAKVSGLIMDMLTVNAEIRPMARYPNFDSTAVRFNGTSADATSPERIKRWKDPSGGYLHAMHQSDWGDFHYRITGKTNDNQLKMEGGWQNNRQSGLSKENRMVENIFEELDAPGEWFYDSKTSTLYYYPYNDEDVNKVTFETAQLKHLLEFRGTLEKPVKNIFFEGIHFTQTRRTFMENYEPLLRSDWTIYRGGAVVFEGSENCGLIKCDLNNLGGNAVFFSNYNYKSKITDSHISNVGASAICFVGDPDAVRSPSFEYGDFVAYDQLDRKLGPKNDNYPRECLVYDNLIHNIGLFEKQTTGVELSMSKSITVSHNSIYKVPRAGINVSDGTWGGHVIEFNDVFETVKETGDHGSFNSWGRDRFWHPDYNRMKEIVAKEPSLILADAVATVIIRNNRFRCDRGWDIDLDDGSSNYHIYNNLCLNGGIKLREGFYRIVENNILINNTFHPHVWFENSGDIFTRNIIMAPYQPINLAGWGTLVDYNIFTDKSGLIEAKARNTDENSIYFPVNFKDSEDGDFGVSYSDSEVFEKGFQNFDMNNFGVVADRLRKLAETPKMPLPLNGESENRENIEIWHGIKIKKLETLGERSATGMDAQRGVYVINIIRYDSPLRDYLQANDVILSVNESHIVSLEDFHNTLALNEHNAPLKMVVFRNQTTKNITIPNLVLTTN